MQQRRSTDGRPWYQDPAWLTLALALAVNMVMLGYTYGCLNSRVDSLAEGQRQIMQLLLDSGKRSAVQSATYSTKGPEMHYANGRRARNGDKIVFRPAYGGAPMIGILYDAREGGGFCYGKMAFIATNDPYANLSQCLHLDDVLAALPEEVPDTSDD